MPNAPKCCRPRLVGWIYLQVRPFRAAWPAKPVAVRFVLDGPGNPSYGRICNRRVYKTSAQVCTISVGPACRAGPEYHPTPTGSKQHSPVSETAQPCSVTLVTKEATPNSHGSRALNGKPTWTPADLPAAYLGADNVSSWCRARPTWPHRAMQCAATKQNRFQAAWTPRARRQSWAVVCGPPRFAESRRRRRERPDRPSTRPRRA